MSKAMESWASHPWIADLSDTDISVITDDLQWARLLADSFQLMGLTLSRIYLSAFIQCAGNVDCGSATEVVEWADNSDRGKMAPGKASSMSCLYIYDAALADVRSFPESEKTILIEIGCESVSLSIRQQRTISKVIEISMVTSPDDGNGGLSAYARKVTVVADIVRSLQESSLQVSLVFRHLGGASVLHYQGLVVGEEELLHEELGASRGACVGIEARGRNQVSVLNGLIIPLFDYEYGFVGTNPMEILIHFEVPHGDVVLETLRKVIAECLRHFDLFNAELVNIDGQYYLLHNDSVPSISVRPRIYWDPAEFELAQIHRYLKRARSWPGEKLFHATLTPTQSGILLGMALSHLVADGNSFVTFIKSVMNIVLGIPATLPSRQRSFYSCGRRVCFDVDAARQPIHDFRGLMESDRFYKYQVVSEDTLEFLLDRYGGNLLAPRHSVLSAYVMKTYIHYFYRNTATVRFRTACDLRDRYPEIKRNYLGNAFVDVVVEFGYEDFQDMSIGQVARAIDSGMRAALSAENINGSFCLTKNGVSVINKTGVLGSGFNPDTDIVGTGLAVSFGGSISSAIQMMKPIIFGPFFAAHKGFLMYEKDSATHLAIISDRRFADDLPDSAEANEDLLSDEILVAY